MTETKALPPLTGQQLIFHVCELGRFTPGTGELMLTRDDWKSLAPSERFDLRKTGPIVDAGFEGSSIFFTGILDKGVVACPIHSWRDAPRGLVWRTL